MPPIPNLLPVLALLLAATFWGLVWYPLRQLNLAGLNGPWQTLISYGAAFIVLLPFIHQNWRQDIRMNQVDLAVLLLSAGWLNVAFVLAMLDGTVARVLLFFYLSPVWAILMARVILGEKIETPSYLAILFGMSGAALMLWKPEIRTVWPLTPVDWLALTSGMAFALTNVMTRKLAGVSTVNKTLVTWLGVVLVSLMVIFYQGYELPDVRVSIWAGAVALGIFGFLFITLSLVYGVTRLPIQRSSLILLFEIFVGGVSAWLIAGELMSLLEWLGGMLILAAGLISVFWKGKL